ncbi:MAG TPA: hypothetical protein VJT14_07645 [Candidatus Dormibacteraeota bacterium]|nr:hypothetical protein [Candidatus Dormibacteraeota bacterium]
MKQPWGRTGQATEWDRVVALGHPNVALGHRAILARAISSARRRCNVDVVLD